MDLNKGALDLSDGQAYALDGSEIPFPDLASILSQLPGYAQGDDAGAMRDALLSTIRRLANKVWADIAAHQNGVQSARFADGAALDSIWRDLRKMPRYIGETTSAYRLRILGAATGITPNAIKAAVRQAAAAFGAAAAFQEPATDSMFYADDDPAPEVWCSFWQPDDGVYWNYDPTVPNQTSGGYYVPDQWGALFWIIMQLGAGDDSRAPFMGDGESDIPATGFGYVDPSDFYADDSNDYGFLAFDGDPLELQIAAIGNALKAFGVAWALYEDPFLFRAY